MYRHTYTDSLEGEHSGAYLCFCVHSYYDYEYLLIFFVLFFGPIINSLEVHLSQLLKQLLGNIC